MQKENALAKTVLDAAFVLHKTLGPGLLESAYQSCLFADLVEQGLYVEKEKALPINYKNLQIDQGYRIDLLVENTLVIEIKATDAIIDRHIAQTLTYLRLGGFKLGLLLNFNEPLLKNGIKRVIL